MSPSFILAMAVSASGPTQSSAKATGFFTIRATSAATGRSDAFGSGPLGRPKCESRMTLPPLPASSVMVGAISSMRVASVTAPSSIGTLRSTRKSTSLPFTAASSRLRKRMAAESGESLTELAHRHRGVDHAVGEAPFIVVPRHHPHQGAVHHLGLVHVEDRGVRIVVEIGRNVGSVGIAENALELLLGGALHRGVDLIL